MPLTNRSGSRRPKNIQIQRIRIRNTAPYDTPLRPVKFTSGLLYINQPKHLYTTLYTTLYVMIFDFAVCRSITWASGRGLVPGYLKFFGPQVALSYRLHAISHEQKNSLFPGTTPLPPAFVMDLQHQKHYARDRINQRCINS